MSNCHIAKSSALLETLKILSQSILLFFYFQTTHLLFCTASQSLLLSTLIYYRLPKEKSTFSKGHIFPVINGKVSSCVYTIIFLFSISNDFRDSD